MTEAINFGAGARHRAFTMAVLSVTLTVFPLHGQGLSPPRITAPAPTAEAPEGHYLVTWGETASVPRGVQYQLQYAPSEAFETPIMVDAGPDHASFLSGLPAGTTFVRVRTLGPEQRSEWSAPASIIVIYPEPTVVRRLMVLGTATVFVLIVVVAVGHARTRKASMTAGTSA